SIDEKSHISLVQYASPNKSYKNSPASQTQPAAASEQKPSEPGTPDDPQTALQKLVKSTLAANARRMPTTQNNTPSDILMMALPFGADAKVYQPNPDANSRDKNAPKGTTIYSIGTLCWNYPCASKTLLRTDGQRIYARLGADYQKRPASFLALLAMSNIMPNYEIKVNGGLYSISHLIASEKASISKGMNLSMALVGLSFYSESSDRWKNELGEVWSIERMLTEELNRSINQGSCDVTDWLLGLTAAVSLYEEEGKAIRGPVALAKKQLQTYRDFVLSIQNENYLWHPKFFLYKGTSADMYETLYSSGHILRWFLVNASEKELNDQRVRNAVSALATTINRIPPNTALGSMTDRQVEALATSLHAISIFSDRVYGKDIPETPSKNSVEKSAEKSVTQITPNSNRSLF
ncbi:MAG: hypothetical protein ACRCUY_12775, partial [Thermoguttaceae bacterium]